MQCFDLAPTFSTLAMVIAVIGTDQGHDFSREGLEGGVCATDWCHLV